MLDLLVSLATAAARSRRRAAVFGDFPHVPDPADPAGPAPLDPARPDWPALQAALERIPSVAELAAAGPGSRRVQEFVARRGEGRLGFDLAKWLAGTNRARLSMLVARPGQDHAGPLPAVATPFQYVVGAESAEKEEAFAARVAAAGGRRGLRGGGPAPLAWGARRFAGDGGCFGCHLWSQPGAGSGELPPSLPPQATRERKRCCT